MTKGLKKVMFKQTAEIKSIIQIVEVNERKVQSMFMNFVPKWRVVLTKNLKNL